MIDENRMERLEGMLSKIIVDMAEFKLIITKNNAPKEETEEESPDWGALDEALEKDG